jgi:probable HAF family extracellular repeat protein
MRFTKESVMPFRKAVLSLAVLLLASASLALAQGTYTQIDYPGAISTQVWGINSAGDIVGGYVDSSGDNHGFLLSGGAYTTIDDPDVPGASVVGINDVGQVVGNNWSVSSYSGGYLYDLNTQTFTTISFPKTGGFTFPLDINNAGLIVGVVEVPRHTGTDVYGFELNNGSYQLIEHPAGSTDTQLWGINNSGVAIGFQWLGGPNINFLYVNGKYKPIQIHAKDPAVFRINDNGAIVGYDQASNGLVAGFLYQDGSFQEISFPGSIEAFALGINNSGVVVGYFSPGGNWHGFTWTPPADAAKK